MNKNITKGNEFQKSWVEVKAYFKYRKKNPLENVF